ncbi:MAG: hypothetical protein AB7G75_29510 [Candidatus Binatia bacterium]
MTSKTRKKANVTPSAFQDAVRRQVRYSLGKEWRDLSGPDLFLAVTLAVRDRIFENITAEFERTRFMLE